MHELRLNIHRPVNVDKRVVMRIPLVTAIRHRRQRPSHSNVCKESGMKKAVDDRDVIHNITNTRNIDHCG